jgi:hypothetical protein
MAKVGTVIPLKVQVPCTPIYYCHLLVHLHSVHACVHTQNIDGHTHTHTHTYTRAHACTHTYILNLWHCCHCRKNITLAGEKWCISLSLSLPLYIHIYIKSNVAYIYVWRDAVCFYEGVAHTLAWKIAPSQPLLPVLHGISHIKQAAVVLPSSPYGLCKQSSHCK